MATKWIQIIQNISHQKNNRFNSNKLCRILSFISNTIEFNEILQWHVFDSNIVFLKRKEFPISRNGNDKIKKTKRNFAMFFLLLPLSLYFLHFQLNRITFHSILLRSYRKYILLKCYLKHILCPHKQVLGVLNVPSIS